MVMLIVKLVLAGFHLPSSPMQNKTALIPQGSIQPGGVPRPSWKQAALASAAALAMMGVSLDAQALALGAITVRSALGEPLRAEIEVPQISSEEATSFQASLGSQQAFRAAGVDYSPALAGARVTLHRRANGEAYLRLVGNRPVNEPFVGVVIEANWANGRIVRDYTMLVDPPGRGAPRPVTVTQSQVSPSVATPLPAPPLNAAPRPPPRLRLRRPVAAANRSPCSAGIRPRVWHRPTPWRACRWIRCWWPCCVPTRTLSSGATSTC